MVTNFFFFPLFEKKSIPLSLTLKIQKKLNIKVQIRTRTSYTENMNAFQFKQISCIE